MSEPLDLDAIRARAEAASEGPWECNAYHVFMDGRAQVRIAHPGRPGVLMGTMLGSDAEFIAHARTDIPALLARIAELEAADTENRRIFAKYVGELHTALLDVEQLTFERDQARARVAELEEGTGRLACCEAAAED